MLILCLDGVALEVVDMNTGSQTLEITSLPCTGPTRVHKNNNTVLTGIRCKLYSNTIRGRGVYYNAPHFIKTLFSQEKDAVITNANFRMHRGRDIVHRC